MNHFGNSACPVAEAGSEAQPVESRCQLVQEPVQVKIDQDSGILEPAIPTDDKALKHGWKRRGKPADKLFVEQTDSHMIPSM
ncbi:MAG: hypothetical protein ABIK07_14640 [Planctomycetota bacterium]